MADRDKPAKRDSDADGGSVWAFWVLVLVLLVFQWGPIGERYRDEVTVYPTTRQKEGLFPANRQTFKVFPATQTVVSWFPGIDEVPRTVGRCSVRDRLNWTCEFTDGSGILTMSDGTFSERTPAPILSAVGPFVYIGRLNWWYCSLTGPCSEWTWKRDTNRKAVGAPSR